MYIGSSARERKVYFLYGVAMGALALLLIVSVKAQARRLTGALKVITGQAGSVVFINNVRHGVTNDKGELDLPRVFAGSYTARVRTVGFTDWSGPVVIVASG